MKILAIETSCDETAVAVVESGGENTPVSVLSNMVSSSLPLHIKTGGIVPEVAAREQASSMVPVLDEALSGSGLKLPDIDAIAVTQGPGLIGSLLVGVETAKILSKTTDKPLLPVNHLLAHLMANFIDMDKVPEFPAIRMVVSGGHTDIILMKNPSEYEWVGGTRDDAAGECFDKTAKILLGATYPGGPVISEAASKITGDVKKILPRPMMNSGNLEMSFSGLKTAVLNKIKGNPDMTDGQKNMIAHDLEAAIVEVLISKLRLALTENTVKSVLVGGGVLVNTRFRAELKNLSDDEGLPIYFPDKKYCSDNAAMIGACALVTNPKKAKVSNFYANPSLVFHYDLLLVLKTPFHIYNSS